MNRVCYDRGLLWVWSIMSVASYERVNYECGESWIWSVMKGSVTNVICHKWVCYKCGLLRKCSAINVVCECGLLWTWSVVNVVCRERGLSWTWSVENVVCCERGLSWRVVCFERIYMNVVCCEGWSVMKGGLFFDVIWYERVCHECGLLWTWFPMNVVCYERAQ